jgi:putative salt-induced outer membrane protein
MISRRDGSRTIKMTIHRISTLILAFGLLTLPLAGFADEEEQGWSGRVGLGYLASNGNTNSTTLNFDTAVHFDRDKWHHTGIARVVGKSEDEVTTAESYKALYEAKYDITDRNYAFGLLDYLKDRFSSYDQQFYAVAGLGRRFILTEKHKLNGQVGLGANRSELQNGVEEDEFTVRVSGDYLWNITENSSFSQTVAVSGSSSNTFTEATSELRAGIIGSLNMVLGYTIRHNTDVLVGTDKTDTLTSISLEYLF